MSAETFDVGGVRLPRPFKLLRLGHFGVNVNDPDASRDFYTRLLGFRGDDNATYQFLTEVAWVPQLGIQYKVGLDGISLVLLLVAAAAFTYALIPARRRGRKPTETMESL